MFPFLSHLFLGGFNSVGASPTDIGTVGAAIAGGVGCPSAQLILYKNPKDYLCTANIDSAFRYTVAGDHYASFYDKDQVAWSIRFADGESERAFAIHVALAQYLVGGMQAMVALDEVVPAAATHVVESGDMLGLKYTAWLVAENGACGKQLDTNTDKSTFYKLRLGDRGAMLAGWHDALAGMKKGGKRLVVLPPELAYGQAGAPPAVPANTSVVFELEICRLKSAAHQLNTSLDSAMPSPIPSIPSSPVHHPSEYQVVVSHPTPAPALAPAPAPATAPAPAPAPALMPPPEMQQQQQQQQQQMYTAGAMTMYTPMQQFQPQMQPQMQQPQMQPQTPVATPAYAGSGLSTADTIQMVMEDRQFRSDLKMTLGAFQAKLDEVAGWVRELRQPAAADENVEVSGMMVLQTMQKLVDQSERCRYEVQDKVQTIASLGEKVRELEESNQRFVEESAKMTAMRDEAHRRELEQARLQRDELSGEKARVQAELAQTALALQNAQAQLAAQTNATGQVQAELARTRDDARSLTAALDETKALVARADERSAKEQAALQDEKRAALELRATIDALQRKVAEQQDALASAEQLAAAQKARAASDLANAQHEMGERCDELNAQIARLQKQIAKMEASAPKVEEIEADAERKWKRKAELAIEEARVATDDMYTQKLRDADKRAKALRAEKTRLEEELEAAQAALRQAARAAKDAEPMRLAVPAVPAAAAQPVVRVKKVVVRSGVPVPLAREKFAALRQKHHDEMIATVKNGMNGVFHALKELIDADESYDGSAVLNAIKRTIKKSTLQYLGELEGEGGDDDDGIEAFLKAAEAQTPEEEEVEEEENETVEEEDHSEAAAAEEDTVAPVDDEPKEAAAEDVSEEEPKKDEKDEEEEEETSEKPVDEEKEEKEEEKEEEEEKTTVPSIPASPTLDAPEEPQEPVVPVVETKDLPVIHDDDLLKDSEDESAAVPAPVPAPVEDAAPVESEGETEPKPDGHLATKPLFSDDEGDDDDDIHIPPAPATEAPAPAAAVPAAAAPAAAPARLFEDDDDDDWGHDDDPLSFLKK